MVKLHVVRATQPYLEGIVEESKHVQVRSPTTQKLEVACSVFVKLAEKHVQLADNEQP